jgi:hypothetical protein
MRGKGLRDYQTTGLRDYETTGPQTTRPETEDDEARDGSDEFAEFAGFLLDSLDQAVKTGEGLFRLRMKATSFLNRKIAQPPRQMNEILGLGEGPARDI